MNTDKAPIKDVYILRRHDEINIDGERTSTPSTEPGLTGKIFEIPCGPGNHLKKNHSQGGEAKENESYMITHLVPVFRASFSVVF